jgi:glycosyltransferase involved in cell wall biosynthesis
MNILVLCTYPIKNPRHGGQLRVRNIVDAYLAAGHKVEIIGVLGAEHYPQESGYLPFPGKQELERFVENSFLMEDYAIGSLFASDDFHYQRMVSKITVSPDVIQVEHPWLFSVAQRFADLSKLKPYLIYSSHNVEWQLKNKILSSYFDKARAELCANLIKEVELQAIRGSDAIVCVSEGDADWLKTQGSTNIVLAQNGVKPWHSSEAGRAEAKAIVGSYRYSLYCASAHPPNITGFFDMFSGGFGSLKPDEKLVTVGSVGWPIAGDVRVHQSAKLAEKVVIAGEVSQACLEGMLDMAHCIVLPITQGGGTNLKTAEALWAGKHVVATSIAMRGFEDFIGQKGVYIADDPATFKRALRSAMAMNPLQLSKSEVNMREKVLWGPCLNSLSILVNKFFEETSK